MTRPADPSRPAGPSVREIAELTARLREISARGRDVDPAERAAFLADKDALIARITDSAATTDPGTDGDRTGGLAEGGGPAQGHVCEDAVSVSSAVDARFLIDGDRFRWAGGIHDVDDAPLRHDGRVTVPTRAVDGTATYVELAEGDWVDLTERRTDAEHPDTSAAEKCAARGAPGPITPAHTVRPDTGRSPEEQRREQLIRWHAEEQTAGHDDRTNRATGGGEHPGLGRE